MDRSNNVWFYLLEPADQEDRLHPVVHDVKLKLPLQVVYLTTDDCPYTSHQQTTVMCQNMLHCHNCDERQWITISQGAGEDVAEAQAPAQEDAHQLDQNASEDQKPAGPDSARQEEGGGQDPQRSQPHKMAIDWPPVLATTESPTARHVHLSGIATKHSYLNGIATSTAVNVQHECQHHIP